MDEPFALDLDEPANREHVSRCAACKHRLRTEASRGLGLGPDCASKLGITSRRPVRITGVAKWRDCDGQISLLDEAHPPTKWSAPEVLRGLTARTHV
ncbi:hypothetical protein E1286_09430 [Nonomuraea terrae]|uniref:Uncharacterized protein n=1 Tax=Nonomuraea terrae TaxID=2530383 RepID=A0A4R4Z4S5_9ACTN|nr:DUF6011 domain-containing protein [Nonomuraea terrae]TDD52044.1 hypothetical protein E1286_09430 [Nonomuraea terrae]